MSGETDLQKLLAHMRPMRDPQPYVFATFAHRSMADLAAHNPVALMAETEGVTAVLPAEEARQLGLADAEWYYRITLTVHSSLEAVGLTAAVSKALAAEGIPANVVAAYFHDHVFVPDNKADEAIEALRRLCTSASEAQH